MTFSPFDCMADTVAPYRHPDDGHRRHGKRLSIENGGHHLAAVPFYFLLVVGHTLSGRQHIVNDNDFFSLYITGNLVIPLYILLSVLFYKSLPFPMGFLSLFVGEYRTKRINAKPHSIRMTKTDCCTIGFLSGFGL